MIDLVINEYGYRKEDRHKCSYRVKVADRIADLRSMLDLGGFIKSKEIK